MLGQVTIPLVTPLHEGRIDTESLEKLLDHVVRQQGRFEPVYPTLFLLGHTGEFQHLSLEQKIIFTKETVKRLRSRRRVVVGINAPTLTDMQTLIEVVNDYTIDAAVLAPEYSCDVSSQEQLDHALAYLDKPLILYNNPQICKGRNIPLETVKELKDNPLVWGIKDSSGDKDYFLALQQFQGNGFSVHQGSERALLETHPPYSNGVVAGTANVNVRLFSQLYDTRKKQDWPNVLKDIRELKTLIAEQGQGNYVLGIKKILALQGIIRSSEMARRTGKEV